MTNEQYAHLGYDKMLEQLYVINTVRIDYIEKGECDGEPTHYIIKLSDGSCIVTIDTVF